MANSMLPSTCRKSSERTTCRERRGFGCCRERQMQPGAERGFGALATFCSSALLFVIALCRQVDLARIGAPCFSKHAGLSFLLPCIRKDMLSLLVHADRMLTSLLSGPLALPLSSISFLKRFPPSFRCPHATLYPPLKRTNICHDVIKGEPPAHLL